MKLGPYYHNLELEELNIEQLLTLHGQAFFDFRQAYLSNMRYWGGSDTMVFNEVRKIEYEIKRRIVESEEIKSRIREPDGMETQSENVGIRERLKKWLKDITLGKKLKQ